MKPLETPVNETYFVYILECSDKTLYTGMTNNLDRRIDQHNKGTKAGGAKYTSGRRPVILMKSFMVANKSEALKLEYKIKQLSHEEKLKFSPN